MAKFDSMKGAVFALSLALLLLNGKSSPGACRSVDASLLPNWLVLATPCFDCEHGMLFSTKEWVAVSYETLAGPVSQSLLMGVLPPEIPIVEFAYGDAFHRFIESEDPGVQLAPLFRKNLFGDPEATWEAKNVPSESLYLPEVGAFWLVDEVGIPGPTPIRLFLIARYCTAAGRAAATRAIEVAAHGLPLQTECGVPIRSDLVDALRRTSTVSEFLASAGSHPSRFSADIGGAVDLWYPIADRSDQTEVHFRFDSIR